MLRSQYQIENFVSANKHVVYGSPLGYLKCPFTDEEDEFILRIQERNGNKWTHISRQMADRLPNAIKRRWQYLRSRKLLEEKRRIPAVAQRREGSAFPSVAPPIGMDLFLRSFQ
jgi:hypothetical protein